jgi:hypothetical protein
MTRFLQHLQFGVHLSPEREWSQSQEAAWAFLARYRQHAFKAIRRLSGACSGQAAKTVAACAQTKAPALEDKADSFSGPVPVVARIELGPGNAVFIRGEGGGLNWHRGLRLDCIAPGAWIWFAKRLTDKVVFQLLLNDSVWAKGDNIVLEPGSRIELTPDFEWPEVPRTA